MFGIGRAMGFGGGTGRAMGSAMGINTGPSQSMMGAMGGGMMGSGNAMGGAMGFPQQQQQPQQPRQLGPEEQPSWTPNMGGGASRARQMFNRPQPQRNNRMRGGMVDPSFRSMMNAKAGHQSGMNMENQGFKIQRGPGNYPGVSPQVYNQHFDQSGAPQIVQPPTNLPGYSGGIAGPMDGGYGRRGPMSGPDSSSPMTGGGYQDPRFQSMGRMGGGSMWNRYRG